MIQGFENLLFQTGLTDTPASTPIRQDGSVVGQPRIYVRSQRRKIVELRDGLSGVRAGPVLVARWDGLTSAERARCRSNPEQTKGRCAPARRTRGRSSCIWVSGTRTRREIGQRFVRGRLVPGRTLPASRDLSVFLWQNIPFTDVLDLALALNEGSARRKRGYQNGVSSKPN
jgi:hypothetical protein